MRESKHMARLQGKIDKALQIADRKLARKILMDRFYMLHGDREAIHRLRATLKSIEA